MINYKYLYLIIPTISVYIVSIYYPVRNNAGKELWFRPPAYVFSIVWPVLLALIGYSWFLQPKLTPYYSILTFLLSIWSIFFTYNKYYAFINILITILVTLYLINKNFLSKPSLLLIPLISWLSFASILNYYSI